MADEPVDLRFLGEQIKRLQGDVRDLRIGASQLRVGMLRVKSEMVEIRAAISRFEMRMNAFAERMEGRFDQIADLIKSSSPILDQGIERADTKIAFFR